jgi:hypothetical protein
MQQNTRPIKTLSSSLSFTVSFDLPFLFFPSHPKSLARPG